LPGRIIRQLASRALNAHDLAHATITLSGAMRLLRTVICGLAVVVGLQGCGSPTQPFPPTTDGGLAQLLNGAWAQQGTVVGSSLVLTLGSLGTMLSGTGQYAIEAGRSGTLTLTGSVSNQRVHLDLVYDTGAVAQLDGTLADRNTLAGAMHNGPPQSLTPSFLVTFARATN
jgi:hypothetical protein